MPHSHQHNHHQAMRMNQQFQKKSAFDSYIHDVVIKDIKGEGYEVIIKKETPAIKYVNF